MLRILFVVHFFFSITLSIPISVILVCDFTEFQNYEYYATDCNRLIFNIGLRSMRVILFGSVQDLYSCGQEVEDVQFTTTIDDLRISLRLTTLIVL